jgi:hypothetical protein
MDYGHQQKGVEEPSTFHTGNFEKITRNSPLEQLHIPVSAHSRAVAWGSYPNAITLQATATASFVIVLMSLQLSVISIHFNCLHRVVVRFQTYKIDFELLLIGH